METDKRFRILLVMSVRPVKEQRLCRGEPTALCYGACECTRVEGSLMAFRGLEVKCNELCSVSSVLLRSMTNGSYDLSVSSYSV